MRTGPEHADNRPLPGVIALHCHAGVKHSGAERLVTTRSPSAGARQLRAACYEGQALADRLAREGFAVLAHDAFGWGSRDFRLDPPSWRLRSTMAAYRFHWSQTGQAPGPDEVYDVAAAEHEATGAKYAGVMGTSFAGGLPHRRAGHVMTWPHSCPVRRGAGFPE
jgi:dienelactone hydrolase